MIEVNRHSAADVGGELAHLGAPCCGAQIGNLREAQVLWPVLQLGAPDQIAGEDTVDGLPASKVGGLDHGGSDLLDNQAIYTAVMVLAAVEDFWVFVTGSVPALTVAAEVAKSALVRAERTPFPRGGAAFFACTFRRAPLAQV